MLGFFRGKGKRKENKNENIIYTPCKGTVVPITEVPDPVFSEKVLGDGFAVIPAEGKIYAPTDGEVTLVFDTLHAVGMTSSMGTEILIHIGLIHLHLGENHSQRMLRLVIRLKKVIFWWKWIWIRLKRPV